MEWRKIGQVPYATWYDELTGGWGASNRRTYMTQLDKCWDAAKEHSGLCLAQLFVESQGGRDGRLAPPTHPPPRLGETPTPGASNPLGLRPRRDGKPVPGSNGTIDLGDSGVFLTFEDYPSCIAEWYRRITDPSYPYARTRTLEEYVHVYAPNGDGANNEAAYVARVTQLVQKWGLVPKENPVPTDPTLPVGIPVTRQIIPLSAAHRPGTKLTSNWEPYGVTVHETDNKNRGANAQMHANYLTNGAEGRVVSWHVTVDDKGAYQHLPLDEIGYHASDGADDAARDQGAFGTVAIELCVNAGQDKAKARQNLAEIIARIEAGDPAFDWGGGQTKGKFGRLYEHFLWTPDKKNCPALMRNEGFVPADGVIDEGPLYQLIQDQREIWVTGDVSEQIVTPGMPLSYLEEIWGNLHPPDPKGPVFKLYVENAKATGQWPAPDGSFWGVHRNNATYWHFTNGLIIWRPDGETAVRVLR